MAFDIVEFIELQNRKSILRLYRCADIGRGAVADALIAIIPYWNNCYNEAAYLFPDTDLLGSPAFAEFPQTGTTFPAGRQ